MLMIVKIIWIYDNKRVNGVLMRVRLTKDQKIKNSSLIIGSNF